MPSQCSPTPRVQPRTPRRSLRARRAPRAFTLIEIMVVVIVIGVLATLIIPTLFGRAGKARTAVAKQKIAAIETAIQLFEQDYGRFPESLQELVTAPADVPSDQLSPPTLKAKDLNDPWGNEFAYTFPGNNYTYDLVSLGADGAEGGEGEALDVTNY